MVRSKQAGDELAEAAYLEACDRVAIAARTGLSNLDLSDLKFLNRIPSLDTLPQLFHLSIRNTGISDLSPLADLRALRQLNITNTKVTDISPLSKLKTLQVLGARSIRINNLTALTSLYELTNINLRETYVKDLSPLANLVALQSLILTKTRVSDVSPLAELPELRSLNLRDTRVSDVACLKNLSLEVLDISGSRVRDLSSLAGQASLIPAAARDPEQGGVKFDGCPLDDKVLLTYADLPNPNRTIETIAHLRRIANLPPLESSIDALGPAADSKEIVLPAQGVGPHFLIEEGLISFAPPTALDALGNHVGRLEQIQPLLVDAASSLVSSIGAGNIPHAQLFNISNRYLEAIRRPLQEVQFAQLYGYGLRLQNASAAAQRQIVDRELPELTDTQREALDSVLDLHGPFILSSSEGLALISDAERYQRTRDEQADLQEAAFAVSKSLERSEKVIEPGVAEFLVETSAELGKGERPERTGAFGEAVIRNAAIVLIGGSVIGAVTFCLVAAPFPTSIALFVASALGKEGIKNSKVGKLAGEELSKKIDRATFDFVINNERALRKLAGKRKNFEWVHKCLDWLVEKSDLPKS